jgi:hypothetical protein
MGCHVGSSPKNSNWPLSGGVPGTEQLTKVILREWPLGNHISAGRSPFTRGTFVAWIITGVFPTHGG